MFINFFRKSILKFATVPLIISFYSISVVASQSQGLSKTFSISGVSSGAFMAIQMGVAYSKDIHGVGSVAGGIFGCAQGNSLQAVNLCMKNPGLINSLTMNNWTYQLATMGLVDNPKYIKSQKIYLYHSAMDSVVNFKSTEKINEYYKNFGVNPKNIHFEKTISSAHGFLSLNTNQECMQAKIPWMPNCNYNQAWEILKTTDNTNNEIKKSISNHLFQFLQAKSALGIPSQAQMEDFGYIYVPQICQKRNGGRLQLTQLDSTQCRVHVALHGCQMNTAFSGDSFPRYAGYNNVAEGNNLIIVYPMAKTNALNPQGCWDWFGYTSSIYYTQQAPQMKAVYSIVEAALKNQLDIIPYSHR